MLNKTRDLPSIVEYKPASQRRLQGGLPHANEVSKIEDQEGFSFLLEVVEDAAHIKNYPQGPV